MAWHEAAKLGDLVGKEVIGVEAGGREVAIYRLEDGYFATENICTHQFAYMSEGYVQDGCIECPLHQAIFDIRSGAVEEGPANGPLATFPVRVDGETIMVELP